MKAPGLLRRSLAARLALIYGLTSIALVAGLGVGVYALTVHYVHDQVDGELAALADFYAAYTAAAVPTDSDVAALAPQIVSFFAPQAGYEVRIFSVRSGVPLAATAGGSTLPSGAALTELRAQNPALFLATGYDVPDRRYAARSVPGADGSARAVIEVSRDVADVQAFLRVLLIILGAATGLAAVAALAASLLLARRVTRPLREVEVATRAIAAGDFGRRLQPASADEVGRLMTSVNDMAAELGRLESVRRDFLAKISHDLRTPLTAIKGFIVNLQDEAPADMQPALATMDDESNRLIRLVEDLLAAARLQQGELRLQRSMLDMAAVARATAAVIDPRAKRLGVELGLDLPDGLPRLAADGDRLQQATLNLLDNALRASPAGSTVWLAVRAQGDGLTLTVTDAGPGLSAEAEARAFEPYFRGAEGGTGLGLAIAHDIVAAHGGSIWLRNRPEGGAEAGFTLPLAAVGSTPLNRGRGAS